MKIRMIAGCAAALIASTALVGIPATRVSAYATSTIADKAEESKDGTPAGWCKEFVNNVVSAQTGINLGGYQDGFFAAKAVEITDLDKAVRGDIIQITPAGSDDNTAYTMWNSAKTSTQLHTAIITAPRNADGTFNVIDSNWGNTMAVLRHPLNLSFASGSIIKIWRFGTASTAVRGKADAIAVNDSGITFSPSNGTTFSGYSSTGPFYGTRGTYFADVTGDGMADAIVVNDSGITVRRSTGSAFSSTYEAFTAGPFYGSRGTYFADVNGDSKADAIAVNDSGITVSPSDGTRFSGYSTTGPFYGSRGTYFADVNGDSKADAIAVNDSGITVSPSDGTRFSGYSSTGPFYGTRGTYFADVTGDGKADAIVVNDTGITVRRSAGNGFSSTYEAFTTGPFYGSRGTYFADVTGDGKADAIAVNDSGITFSPSNSDGTRFSGYSTTGPFYGSRGTYFADVDGK